MKTTNNKPVIKEYSLSTNEFDTPMEFTDLNALAVLIVRLFLLDPGTLTNNPECGIGLRTKYSHLLADKLEDFKQDAKDQLSRYLGDQYTQIDCNARFMPNDAHLLIIDVFIESLTLSFSYDLDTKTLNYIKEKPGGYIK